MSNYRSYAILFFDHKLSIAFFWSRKTSGIVHKTFKTAAEAILASLDALVKLYCHIF